jgi:hypothetical protein
LSGTASWVCGRRWDSPKFRGRRGDAWTDVRRRLENWNASDGPTKRRTIRALGYCLGPFHPASCWTVPLGKSQPVLSAGGGCASTSQYYVAEQYPLSVLNCLIQHADKGKTAFMFSHTWITHDHSYGKRDASLICSEKLADAHTISCRGLSSLLNRPCTLQAELVLLQELI